MELEDYLRSDADNPEFLDMLREVNEEIAVMRAGNVSIHM